MLIFIAQYLSLAEFVYVFVHFLYTSYLSIVLSLYLVSAPTDPLTTYPHSLRHRSRRPRAARAQRGGRRSRGRVARAAALDRSRAKAPVENGGQI